MDLPTPVLERENFRKLTGQLQLDRRRSDNLLRFSKRAIDIASDIISTLILSLSNDLESEIIWFLALKRLKQLKTCLPVKAECAIAASILFGAETTSLKSSWEFTPQ